MAQHGVALRRVAGNSLAGDYDSGGQPGAAHLSLPRPAGAGNKSTPAWRFPLGGHRQNPDGRERRYYLSNASENTRLVILAHVGGSR